MKPEFDDREWTRQREPLMLGRPSYGKWEIMLDNVQRAFYRTMFEIPDSAKATNLRLHVVYRGGVRVFLNGRELARGHLPKGDLAPADDIPAEPYPREAYLPPEGEFATPKVPDGTLYFMPDLDGAFELAPPVKDDPNRRIVARNSLCPGIPITRAGWDKVQKLRNRELDAPLPKDFLRKGTNFLAVEMRAGELDPIQQLQSDNEWVNSGGVFSRNRILKIELSGDPAAASSCLKRPPGVQVWVEDIHHRLYSPEFFPPGEALRSARIVGARNGTYAAQIVVGTDRALDGLKVSVGDFKAAAGNAAIPASAASLFYGVPHPIEMMGLLGQDYKGPGGVKEVDEYNATLDRHGGFDGKARADKERTEALKRIQFFDHLSSVAPAQVPADACQPVWLSLKIPKDAAPGVYKGTLRVEAAGMEPATVTVETEIFDWSLPDPVHLRTVLSVEQSPYGVARHYKVPLWSDEHFKLMEKSFALLGTVGDDWLNVPVLSYTEFGNNADSPVRIIRKANQEFAFDFSVLDRYLALAVKYWGAPRVVDFVVNQPGAQGGGDLVPPLEITVLDEPSGKKEVVKMNGAAEGSEARRLWKALATALYAHMKELKLEKSMYWGLPWDTVGEPSVPGILAEYAPAVHWVRQSHAYRPDATYTAVSTLFGFDLGFEPGVGFASRKGWKRSNIHLLFPRNQGDVVTCWGPASPFVYRLMMDRVLVAGGNGVARLGAEYWDDTWYNGFKGRIWCPGIAGLMMLWPGPNGAEPSVRLEMLREGLQEAELRIFLEKASEKIGAPDTVKKIVEALRAHSVDTLLLEPRSPYVKLGEQCSGWQTRSRKLYALAADVAKTVPVELETNTLTLTVPVRTKTETRLQLHNWTATARTCKLSSDQEWIQVKTSEIKSSPGQSEFGLELDSGKLEPEKEYKGALTLTDAVSGWTEKAEIAVSTEKLLAFDVRVLNVAPGKKLSQTGLLQNKSGSELSWNLNASVPWIGVSPASGKLAPGEQAKLALEITPAEQDSARLEAALTVREAGGRTETLPLVVHVVPPYQPPANPPTGGPIPLRTVTTRKIIQGKEGDFWFAPLADRPGWRLGMGRVFEDGALLASVPCDVAYNITNKHFTTFAAEVCLNGTFSNPVDFYWAEKTSLQFQIYADGKLQAQSGFMSLADPPRLLVARGLENAKELRLAVRQQNDEPCRAKIAYWGNPNFYAVPGSPEDAAAVAAATSAGRALYLKSVELSPAYPKPKDNPDQPFAPEIQAEKDKVQWTKDVQFNEYDQIRIRPVLKNNALVVVYARVVLEAEADCRIRLFPTIMVGDRNAGESLAVFVNGQNVYRKKALVALKPEERQVDIALVKGRNELLIRVAQSDVDEFLRAGLRVMGLIPVKQIVAE